MSDGCTTSAIENRQDDQSAPVEEAPARENSLEARLAALEQRVEVLERILRRRMW